MNDLQIATMIIWNVPLEQKYSSDMLFWVWVETKRFFSKTRCLYKFKTYAKCLQDNGRRFTMYAPIPVTKKIMTTTRAFIDIKVEVFK